MPDSLHIQALDAKVHDRAGFDCGVSALNDYFAKRARKEMALGVAACFVATADAASKHVLGYYTLSAVSIIQTGIRQDVLGKLPRYREIPATLLGRLAVDSKGQGKGIGARLLVSAMERTLRASSDVASLALVVDPENVAVAGYYRKFGFRLLTAERLFLPMKEVRAILNVQ